MVDVHLCHHHIDCSAAFEHRKTHGWYGNKCTTCAHIFIKANCDHSSHVNIKKSTVVGAFITILLIYLRSNCKVEQLQAEKGQQVRAFALERTVDEHTGDGNEAQVHQARHVHLLYIGRKVMTNRDD